MYNYYIRRVLYVMKERFIMAIERRKDNKQRVLKPAKKNQ